MVFFSTLKDCCSDLEENVQKDFLLNSITIKKETIKFSSAHFPKEIKSKLYHIENSKTREKIV